MVTMNDSANISEMVCRTTVSAPCEWPEEAPVPFLTIKYLDWCTYPILLVICTIGNALNLFVLSREEPQTSKSVYLMAMACSDLTYMWANLIPYFEAITRTRYPFTQDVLGIVFFLQEGAATVTDWILVAFSVDRFLAIKSPLAHRSSNNVFRSKCITAGILGTAGLLTSPRLIDYYWFLANDLGPPHDRPVRPPALKNLRMLYVLTLPLIPLATFMIILTLNLVILRILRTKRISRQGKLRMSRSSSSQSKPIPPASERSATLMLLACVLLYLITQSPSVIINIIEILDLTCVRRHPSQSRKLADPPKMFFVNLNYSLNFVLYCVMDPTFRAALRKHLRRLIAWKRRASQESALLNSPVHYSSSTRSNLSQCGSSRVRSYSQSDDRMIRLDFRLFAQQSKL